MAKVKMLRFDAYFSGNGYSVYDNLYMQKVTDPLPQKVAERVAVELNQKNLGRNTVMRTLTG